MRETFPAYMPQLFKHEGGYVDHPRDPGGATNLGITLATLREWRGRPVTKQDVMGLTRNEAEAIYKDRFWNRIGGDGLLAGPDAMLFDVAVNSGVGRARQWMPLIQGKNAVDGVKAIGARRRAFFRSLRTFDVFGKGWMRRVNEVEAWSLAWALRWQGGAVKPVLEKEAQQSRRNSQAAGGGAVATGGGAIAAPQAEAAAGIDWIALAAVGVPLALLFAFLIYQALMQGARAKAMKEAAKAMKEAINV
jgi:lysozyme family protein